MERTGVWKQGCPVALERLSVLKTRFVDFDGVEHEDGEIVVLDACTGAVAEIFERLYEMRFPINSMLGLHHFDGDDDRAMEANNTSCFNYRSIDGSATISMHSYALAIDLNPLQNPYLIFDEEAGTAKIHPKAGWEYLNRYNRKPGMVEDLRPLFAEAGFSVWGGSWTTPLDYHHFQTPRAVAALLAVMSADDGRRFYELVRRAPEKAQALQPGEETEKLKAIYERSPAELFEKLG